MYNKTKIIFFIFILIAPLYPIQAQKTLVLYEKLNPQIFPFQNEPIKLGILKFKTISDDPDFTEIFYNNLRTDTSIIRKFEIYPYSSLLLLKNNFKIEDLDADAAEVLTKLHKALGITYVISGELREGSLMLFIRNTISGDLLYSNIFRNSDSSTALKDAMKLFSSGLTTKYKSRGSLNIIIQPSDADFMIDRNEQKQKSNIYLNPGKYILEFTKEGYYPLKESIQVEEGQNLYQNYSMVPSFGNLNLEISPPSAKTDMVYVRDTTSVLEVTGSKLLSHIQTGLYHFYFSELGFKPVEREFQIWADTTREEKIALMRQFFVIEEIFTNNLQVIRLNLEPGEEQYKFSYSITGKPDHDYDVNLYLVKKDDPGTLFELKGLKGDIGNIYCGPNKIITWDVKKDFPQNINSNDYRFYLEVD